MGGAMSKFGSQLASNFQTPQGTTPGSVLKGIGDTMDIYQAQGRGQPGQQQPGQQQAAPPAQAAPVAFNTPNLPYMPPPEMENPYLRRNAMYGG
jgi:hypothetical protein